jgi:hypothetical protein
LQYPESEPEDAFDESTNVLRCQLRSVVSYWSHKEYILMYWCPIGLQYPENEPESAFDEATNVLRRQLRSVVSKLEKKTQRVVPPAALKLIFPIIIDDELPLYGRPPEDPEPATQEGVKQ